MANDVSVKIGADTASLERGFAKALTVAEQSAGQMASAFDGLNQTLAGLAGTAAAVALVGIVKGVADAGDQLAKLSTKTGAAVEELSRLQYAGSLADLSNEDLSASLIKLNKVMGEARDGSASAAEALRRFGIDPQSGIGVVQAFTQIAERVKNTGDETRIASGLNDVFGKSFSTLIPILKGGADGIKEAGDELERIGGVMSGETARSAEAFNDNLTRLAKNFDAVKNSVAGPLLPTLNAMAESFLASSDGADKFSVSGTALKTVLETVAVLGANVGYVFTAIGSEIGGIAAQIVALGSGDFKAFSAIGEAMREDAEKARKEIDALSDRLLNPQKSAAPQSAAATGAGIGDASPKGGKPKAEKLKSEKPEKIYDDLAVSAKAYAKTIDQINAAELAADKATRDLNGAQAALFELMRSPEWERMPDTWKQVAVAQASSASAAIQAAEQQKTLNEMIAATPTAKLEEARSRMLLLADAFDAGKISAEQFVEAAQTELGNGPEQLAAFNAKIEAEAERHVQAMKELDDQLNSNRYSAQMMMISGAQDLSDNLMQVLKDSGEEGSALGKALFAAQKAMQVATIIMQGEAASASIMAGMAQAGAMAAALAGPAGPGVLAAYMADGAAMAGLMKTIAYTNAGIVAGSAIASAEGGFDIPAGKNPITQLHEQEMVLPKAQANVIRDLARNGGGAPKLTIINNGTPQRVVGQQRVSADEWAMIVEDAVQATAAQLGDPNSRTSRAMSRSYNVQRSR